MSEAEGAFEGAVGTGLGAVVGMICIGVIAMITSI